ncbi:putative LOC107395156-like protein, partial [Nothobranchius furzeri]
VAPALVCHPIHIAPDLSCSSCEWWVHSWTSPCIRFGLGPARPHGRKPGHQALAHGPQPQAWLQVGTPVTLRAGYSDSLTSRCVERFLSLFSLPHTSGRSGLRRSDSRCCFLFFPQDLEVVTRFLPAMMTVVVDDHTFIVEQKLPSEEKTSLSYPAAVPDVFSRYLQDNRVACEMGLYYVLHIAKLRNKNALQRLLPALGERCSGYRSRNGSFYLHLCPEPGLMFP